MSASPLEEAPGESGLMDGIPADRQDGGAIDGSIYDVPGFMFVAAKKVQFQSGEDAATC